MIPKVEEHKIVNTVKHRKYTQYTITLPHTRLEADRLETKLCGHCKALLETCEEQGVFAPNLRKC